MAILNSKLFVFLYRLTTMEHGRALAQVKPTTLNELPIKTIDLTDEKFLHDEIIRLVDTMIQLNKEKQQTKTPDTLDQLQQRIQYTDEKINKLIYKLYNLTEEEIKIVEGE